MKKILIFIIIISGFNLTAQESRLTIFSENGDDFYLYLNGIRQNENPVVNISVDYLINTYYDAKIVFADENIPSIEKSRLMVVDVDNRFGEFTYKIKETRRGKKLRFFSFTPFQQIVAPPSNVVLVGYNSNPLGPIQTVSQTTTTTTSSSGNGGNVNIGVGINSEGNNVGIGINMNSGNNTTTTTTTTTQTIGGNSNGTVVVQDTGCYAMSNQDFAQAITSIENKTFGDSKLALAKQIAKSNCLTSNQILRITNLFSFEDDKLEFAKFAYTLCFNPENYWKVNDAFDYESSIEELDEYISSLGY